MKNFSLILGLLLSCQYVSAQVADGSKFINGTLRFSMLGNGDNTQSSFTLAPTAGYFINEQTAVGGSLGITSQYIGLGENAWTVYLAPFARRYFSLVDNTFYFFAEGSVGFSYGRSAYGFGNFNSTNDAFSVSFTASPGFAFFPSEQWGLDFTFTGFGLSFYGLGSEGGTTTLFTIGATSFSPSLGFSYYF